MYAFTLEKSSKKHTCPQCGKRTFVRVVSTESGGYLPDYVGRCDRESKCGYEYSWAEYFKDNPDLRENKGYARQSFRNKNASSRIIYSPSFQPVKPDHLELTHLLGTLGNYERNSFIQFLTALFPYDPETANEVIQEYKIGTVYGYSRHHGLNIPWTSFPTIDCMGRFCKAKLMLFNPETGKRIKDAEGKGVASSLESILKYAGKLKQDFETDKDIFFGEHLINKYPTWPIAIVESEKTAVIASLCKAAFPVDMAWLAAGSKSWLKPERIARLGRDKRIILYPDADGFEQWNRIATEARRIGCDVRVSQLAMTQQFDLADYLLAEQLKRNDPVRREAFRYAIEERLAIMTVDGKMNLHDAENLLKRSGYIDHAIAMVTGN